MFAGEQGRPGPLIWITQLHPGKTIESEHESFDPRSFCKDEAVAAALEEAVLAMLQLHKLHANAVVHVSENFSRRLKVWCQLQTALHFPHATKVGKDF